MRQRELERLPPLVVRFLHLMPQELSGYYELKIRGYTEIRYLSVRVRPVSCSGGHVRIGLKGPSPEDTAFFNIPFKDAQRAAQGGVGEVNDLLQSGAREGLKYIEGNHKLWDMLTEKKT